MLKLVITVDADDVIGVKEEISAPLEDIWRVDPLKVELIKIGGEHASPADHS